MLLNRFKLKYNFNNKSIGIISHSIGAPLLMHRETDILKLIFPGIRINGLGFIFGLLVMM